MPVPSLRIPVGLNLDELQKNVETAKGHTRQATQFILKQFADMNAGLGGPAAAGLLAGYGASALRLVGIFGAVATAVKLTGDVIQATRDRLTEMVDVADKANARGLSPEFFQAFVAAAKGAEDRVATLEAALDHVWQATKPLLNPDWSVWDTGVTKVNAVAKAMRETRELFTTDQNFSGFELFKNAKSQDDRIRAVLIYMQQLKAIGQDVAALDIGEKMFGSKFTDDLRQGKDSVDHILQTIETGSKTSFVTNEAAKNAKELDDKLNDAWHTISERLKPDWDDLASVALRIKGAWASIIDAVAHYKTASIPTPAISKGDANGASADDAQNDPDPNKAAFGNPALLNQYRRRRGFASVGDQTSNEAHALDAYSLLNDLSGAPPAEDNSIPMPRRRPQDAPAPPPATKVERDPFQVSVDSVNKRIAALNAETATIGQSTDARERAKTVAQLEEAAKRANTAAGMENTAVTAKQRAEIDKEADAMMRAAAAAEKANIRESIKFNANTALLSPADVQIATQLKGLYPDVATALNSVEASAMRTNDAMKTISGTIQNGLVTGLTDIMDGSKSVSTSFADMGRMVIRALDEMVIKMLIVAPIMQVLQASFGGGASVLSSLPLPGMGNFIGPVAKAGGGYISGPGSSTSDSIPARLSNGEYVVNARATAQHLDLLHAINNGHVARFADGGMVSGVPGPVSGAPMIGGSQTTIAPSFHVTVQGSPGASPADHAKMGEAVAKAAEHQIRSMIGAELRTQMRPGGVLRR
jgi:hypothetical protein